MTSPSAIIGSGTTKGTSVARIRMTSSSPKMLPKSRIVSDRARARCEMPSMMRMIGANAIIQPGAPGSMTKCFRYDTMPCARIPSTLYSTHTVSAQPSVTFTLLVGAINPGTMPARFEIRISRKSEPTIGRYLRPSGPTKSSSRPLNTLTKSSSSTWREPGCSTLRRERTNSANAASATVITSSIAR